jgi:ribosomal protein S18 acetylase RimI-like enzyme
MAPIAPHASLAAIGNDIGPLIGRHLDTAFRAMVRGPNVAAGRAYFRWLTGEPHPMGNCAVLAPGIDAASAREAIEPLVASPLPTAVLLAGMDVPAEIGAYLGERGYGAGALPAMAVDIAGLKDTALPPGYEFVRVGGGDDGEQWVRQFAAGYEIPLGVTQYFSPVALRASTAADAPMQFFAVRRDGAIVGTSVCYLNDGVAGIYCVSTVPAERRKGLGEHLTAEPLRLAAKLGYRVGVLQSSEAGYSVYRKLGFADFGGVPIHVRMPG